MTNPYDEFPYRSVPIEWSAPERLALTSLLHGGPRLSLDDYRVLELGCGNGANLLALAYYRRNASFVGVDGSAAAIARAEGHRATLELPNLRFVHADFECADRQLEGQFDFILAHGVFSWVPDPTRDALFELCARRLRKLGLLYLNYNTLPGWNVRGLVRSFLLARDNPALTLQTRAEHARFLSAQMASALASAPDHPYMKLMEREFRFLSDGDPTYVAHEFLASDNNAYWRSQFLAIAAQHGFGYVADADFDRESGRVPVGLVEQIDAAGFGGEGSEDLLDLVTYRQLHSPIMTSGEWTRRMPSPAELDRLYVAAPLAVGEERTDGELTLRHASGFEVVVKEAAMQRALTELCSIWPRGLMIASLLGAESPFMSDLRLMHMHGLLELRIVEADDPHAPPAALLNQRELEWGGYATTPYHVPFMSGSSAAIDDEV